jgi:uncharacterized protein YecE (DUF72 family)
VPSGARLQSDRAGAYLRVREATMPEIRVGTSGWSYPNWVGPFYPEDLKRNAWLAHYAQHFAAVELNASFYRLPMANMLKGWHRRTPADFAFSVKAWRMITHTRRLADCDAEVQAFHERIAPLGDKAPLVLYQLPPKFPPDAARLDAFLNRLPARPRAAFEFRDPRWFDDAVYDVLRKHNRAFVPFELAEQRSPALATADFVYVRLHGREAKYRGRYPEAALQDWATWLQGHVDAGRDAYVFFDNTDQADDAVRDALRLRALLGA